MMGSWDEPAKYGLRTVAAASIDDTWTAIRLKQEGQTKVSEFCNEEIKNNEHSAFIDLENRKINAATGYAHRFGAAHRCNEFLRVALVLQQKGIRSLDTIRQTGKTKTDRLEKLVEKLSAGKKIHRRITNALKSPRSVDNRVYTKFPLFKY